MKKQVSMILSFLLLIALLLSSCNVPTGGENGSSGIKGSDPQPSQSGSGIETPPESEDESDTESVPETTEPEPLPDIPMKDDKIVVLRYDVPYPEFNSDGGHYGELQPISRELHKRDAYIAETLNANIVYKTPACSQGDLYLNIATIKKDAEISADIVAMSSYLMTSCLIERGHVEDLTNYDGIDLESSWWPKNMRKDVAIGDGIYFVTGDISSGFMLNTCAVFYNRDMLSELKLADPAASVKDGGWTLDKLMTMTAGVYKELDGIEGASEGDRFGIAFNITETEAFFTAGGLSMIKRLNNDITGDLIDTSDELSNGKIGAMVDKLVGWTLGGDVLKEQYSQGLVTDSFASGGSLFAAATVELGVFMKGSDMDYGILPMPIADPSAQSEYYTMSKREHIYYSLIEKSDMEELAVKAIDLMGEYSEQNIKPIVKELAFRSAADSEMFELIYDGVRFDLSDMFGNLFYGYASKAVFNGRTWSSFFTGMTKSEFNVSVHRMSQLFDKITRLCGDE